MHLLDSLRGWTSTRRTSVVIARSLEARTQEIGRELLEAARSHQHGFFSKKFWSDQLMSWAMKDEAFKVQFFRFVDAFPTLRTAEQVHDYLVDYLTQPGVTLPPMVSLGLRGGGLMKGTLSATITSQIEGLAGKFIAGTDVPSALPRLRRMWDAGMGCTVDLLGEACVSEEEAGIYQSRYLDLIRSLPREMATWPANPVLDSDYLGPVPRANVSTKISSLHARTNPIDAEGSIRELLAALRPLLETAAKENVLINFDMEQRSLKDLTLELFERCCQEVDFPAGLALQAYLRSGDDDVRRVINWAKATGRQVTVRLIKGAYWDHETIHAEQMNWASPVWGWKKETDACFERMAKALVEQLPRKGSEAGVKLAVGSHNVRSIAYVLAMLQEHGLPDNAVEFQMLHGMADELKAALTERKLRLREYVPIGQMIPGMAYLVRRLLENTSNESWLRAGLVEEQSPDILLASPHEPLVPSSPLSPSPGTPGEGRGEGLLLSGTFNNEPCRDFSHAEQRQAFARALHAANVPQIASPTSIGQANDALAKASSAFPSWRDTAVHERSTILLRAAALMRTRRDELAGIMIKEAGKTWSEADADVCEAIDFCEFYARAAMPLFQPEHLGHFTGELNQHWHQPRGVAVIISPWNFPLAICTGMTTAALVTGNTALVKPATQTPGIASAMCEILWQAGIPRDVLHFIPGPGATIGAALVRDSRVALIAFTGSKEVGLGLIQAAGITPPDQPFVKHVVCEMGGKNALIIDSSADLDEAIPAVCHSAFSYAGQKCSACSRVIAVDDVHDAFLRRLVEAARALRVGDPMLPSTDVGPVIDHGAADKIRQYIEIGKTEGTLELACPTASDRTPLGKPLIGPHIFSAIRPEHRLAKEEIFGPVLSVMRAKDFTQALAIANSTSYKLTGGVFSRKPSHLDQARRDFRVGNLYLNRGITGALVGRQPFGGFGLSGLGSKAGGGEYLLRFVDPRCCTENMLRRGFAPGSGE